MSSSSADPPASVHSRYVAGFRECAHQVAKYLEKADGLGATTRSTILQHLTRRLHHHSTTTATTSIVHQKEEPDQLSPTVTSSSSSSQPASPHGSSTGFVLQTPSFVNESVSSSAAASVVSHPIQLLPVQLANGQTVFVIANANDLLLPPRHQLMIQMPNEQQTNTRGGGGGGGGGWQTIEGDQTAMHSIIDQRNGVVSYEAISPPPSGPPPPRPPVGPSPVSPLQLSSLQNNQPDLVRPLCSADVYSKPQTMMTMSKYPLSGKGGNSAIHWNYSVNSAASEVAVESKCHASLLGQRSSSAIDNPLPTMIPPPPTMIPPPPTMIPPPPTMIPPPPTMIPPLPQVVAEAMVDACPMSGQSDVDVWRPW